jgi:hypothetical protein
MSSSRDATAASPSSVSLDCVGADLEAELLEGFGDEGAGGAGVSHGGGELF